MNLDESFFLQKNVLDVARNLLGKYLFTLKDGQLAGGVISEVEAYNGVSDKASHAHGGRRTKRNEMMYHKGGVLYMYLCYGMHAMLNVVTNEEDVPDAILIRSIVPTHGEELMLQRTKKKRMDGKIGVGPGKVAKILGLSVSDNGLPLNSNTIWIEDRGIIIPDDKVHTTPRIGVDYAGEDAALPYRYFVEADDLLL